MHKYIQYASHHPAMQKVYFRAQRGVLGKVFAARCLGQGVLGKVSQAWCLRAHWAHSFLLGPGASGPFLRNSFEEVIGCNHS